MWYVYFLELANSDTYVGSTDDLRRRFASHQAGQVIQRNRIEGESHTRALEMYFKSGSGKAFAKKRFLQSVL